MIHPIFTGKNPELWQQVYAELAKALGHELLGKLAKPIMQINSGIDEVPTDFRAGAKHILFWDSTKELFDLYRKCYGCYPAYAYLDVEPRKFKYDANGNRVRDARGQEVVLRTKGEYLTCEKPWEPSLITMTGRKACIVRDVCDTLGAETKLGVWSPAKHLGGGDTTDEQFENAGHIWAVTGTQWYPINANPRRADASYKTISCELEYNWYRELGTHANSIPCTQLDLGDEGSTGDLPESEAEEMLTELIKAFGCVAVWFKTDDEPTMAYAVGLIRRYADSIRRAVRNIA